MDTPGSKIAPQLEKSISSLECFFLNHIKRSCEICDTTDDDGWSSGSEGNGLTE
jgi:hypothetical protein